MFILKPFPAEVIKMGFGHLADTPPLYTRGKKLFITLTCVSDIKVGLHPDSSWKQ